jgi:hypothetical protein
MYKVKTGKKLQYLLMIRTINKYNKDNNQLIITSKFKNKNILINHIKNRFILKFRRIIKTELNKFNKE